jgi:hypothetical protein
MAVRRLLLAALVMGIVGTGTELLLINHVEAWAQLIPVVLLALALPALVWQIAAPRETPVQVFQVTMVLFIAAGLIGLVFHYQGARAFQLEVDPSLNGAALFWKTVRAKAPPALAPGSMIGLGIVGLAYAQCVRRVE